MDLDAIRSGIPALRKTTYVNTGWSGPSPSAVIRAITDFLVTEADDGPTSVAAMERRVEVDRRVRRELAELMHCEPGEVALTDNTTEGINIVFNGMPWQRGDRLVTTAVEHPGIMVPAVFATRRHELDLMAVPCDPSASSEAIVDAFDRAITSNTRLVAVSHISYSNGMRLPLKEIIEIAHSRGALVVADGAQTAGQIALDMRALDIDFYALPGHKWLLGPDGTGALFVRRDRLAELPPAKVGYWATEEYDTTGHLVENVKDARRYQVSTTNGGLWAGLAVAIEAARRLGIEAIEERSTRLASYAVRRLMAVPGVRIVSPREGPAVTGLVCFQLDGVAPDGVTGTLWERAGIVARSVDSSQSTRLSLAYFNTEAEVDRITAAAEEIATRGPIEIEGTAWYRVMRGPADEI